MPTTYEMLQQHRNEILSLASSHGAVSIRVFGSVARGDDTENSDIDFLVNMDKGRSLFDMAKLQFDLENLLHKQIDLVSEKGIYHRLKNVILSEAREF